MAHLKKIFNLNLPLVFILFFLTVDFGQVFAQTPTPDQGLPLGRFWGIGPLGEPIATPEDPGASAFTNFITKTIGIMTVVAFIWFIFVLFTGAIGWLSSGGDKVKLQEAQKKITTSLVGLIIVISAIFLIKIIGNMFGIDILDLTNFITNLGTETITPTP